MKDKSSERSEHRTIEKSNVKDKSSERSEHKTIEKSNVKDKSSERSEHKGATVTSKKSKTPASKDDQLVITLDQEMELMVQELQLHFVSRSSEDLTVPDVRQLLAEYKRLVKFFKEVHKQTGNARIV